MQTPARNLNESSSLSIKNNNNFEGWRRLSLFSFMRKEKNLTNTQRLAFFFSFRIAGLLSLLPIFLLSLFFLSVCVCVCVSISLIIIERRLGLWWCVVWLVARLRSCREPATSLQLYSPFMILGWLLRRQRRRWCRDWWSSFFLLLVFFLLLFFCLVYLSLGNLACRGDKVSGRAILSFFSLFHHSSSSSSSSLFCSFLVFFFFKAFSE